ncbi:hypothetical protein ABE425_02245 [Chryseobacterium cucumeris]|uniref:hypothetical protein n=1 Tax=Chryseobacterium TaxID=59732 RepID=UPI0028830D21|nr:hypothetical protein [Chryseobacterium sp. SG20098]WNI35955.1 hypothetical protein RHP76_18535 [Chryseobacterium sp. SG20098]WNI36549.1 hypothetical protein RHP76_21800 [Chryseobacterium sp. SG20098]
MKKNFITVIVLFSQIVYSQSSGVGINTTTPKSTFDINGKKDSSGLAVSTDIAGLQAPRLTIAELTSKGDTLYGPDQKGAMVYITDVSGGNVTGQRSNITSVGYYYFDGSAWQKMVTTTLQPWHSTTTGTGEATVTENIYHSGNVGIGITSPDVSAALEVASTNKGILIPRVALKGSTDQETISSPTDGLMVYNMGTSGFTFKGFVFWNGTEWRSLNNNPTVLPDILSLNCTDSSTFPTTFTAGAVYNGTLTVPYIKGNGGTYFSGTSFSQNGLTFTLNPGTLNYGNGSISYSISGTPNFTSPNTVSFPISFLGKNCNATVGENVSLNPVQYLKKIVSPIPTTTDAAVQEATKTTFGNLSIRYGGLVNNVKNSANSIQLSPSITTQMTIWGELIGSSSTSALLKQTQATVNSNNWIGWNLSFNPLVRDQGRILVSLHTTGEIYRITILCNDNMTSPAVLSNLSFFIEKLQ